MRIRNASRFLVIALPILALAGLVCLAFSTREKTLGDFTTTLLDRSPEQAHNVDLAAHRLNGRTVKAGEVFSFNEAVGPCTADRGFMRAPTIVRGELADEVGGGICQVSSTLYNAALIAGMQIVERHAHTSPARSVPPGRDATVSFGDKDLRLRNTLGQPITIRAEARSGRLIIRIVGGSAPDARCQVIVETHYPRRSGRTHRSETRTATVWREVTAKDGSTRRDFISTDTYALPE